MTPENWEKAVRMMKVHSKASMGKTSPQGEAIQHIMICDKKTVDDRYEFGEKLGEGSFGVVHSVTNRESGKRWACKIINKEKAGGSKVKLINREVGILKIVHHEHIIKLQEVFETSQKIYLIMELCEGGELSKLVTRSGGRLPECDVRIIMKRLASAISYLHRSGMVHRDLKLENVLLSKNPADSTDRLYIKVTDFGLSVVKNGVTADDMMDEFCGTRLYMAPEINANKTYSEKCDVWAMGIIMCLLLTGQPHPPSSTVGTDDVTDGSHTNNRTTINNEWERISNPAKDCVNQMLNVDTAYRYTASEILTHYFIKEAPPETKLNVLEMMKEFHKDGFVVTDDVAEGGTGVELVNSAQIRRSSISSDPKTMHLKHSKSEHLIHNTTPGKTKPLSQTMILSSSSSTSSKVIPSRPRSSIAKMSTADSTPKNAASRRCSARASISAPQGVSSRTLPRPPGSVSRDRLIPHGGSDSKDRQKATRLSLSSGNLTDGNCLKSLSISSKTSASVTNKKV